MKLIKKVAKETIKTKDGKKEFRPVRYFIVTDNGKHILVQPVFKEDYARLDMVAEYVK